MVHFSVCFADWSAIFPDGEIILIFYFDAPFHIQANKGMELLLTAVKVVRHRIMGRIHEPLADVKSRKEKSHEEKR